MTLHRSAPQITHTDTPAMNFRFTLRFDSMDFMLILSPIPLNLSIPILHFF